MASEPKEMLEMKRREGMVCKSKGAVGRNDERANGERGWKGQESRIRKCSDGRERGTGKRAE